MTKVCSICKVDKDTSAFGVRKDRPNGVRSACRVCTKAATLATKRTKKGLLSGIYSRQIQKSKKRGHPAPSYTLKELTTWIATTNFEVLYEQWVESTYDTQLVPSVDRLDDSKGYSIDNIQLLTWQENNDKYNSDVISGVNTKTSKEVIQKDLEGTIIEVHHSIHSATRKVNISAAAVCKACKGVNNHKSKGFIWEYSYAV